MNFPVPIEIEPIWAIPFIHLSVLFLFFCLSSSIPNSETAQRSTHSHGIRLRSAVCIARLLPECDQFPFGWWRLGRWIWSSGSRKMAIAERSLSKHIRYGWWRSMERGQSKITTIYWIKSTTSPTANRFDHWFGHCHSHWQNVKRFVSTVNTMIHEHWFDLILS